MAPQRSCSFCGKPEREVARLCEGPRACICNESVALCMEIFDEHEPSGKDKPPRNRHLTCSFCGKDERDVRCLIAGPTVFICDGCARASPARRPVHEDQVNAASGAMDVSQRSKFGVPTASDLGYERVVMRA